MPPIRRSMRCSKTSLKLIRSSSSQEEKVFKDEAACHCPLSTFAAAAFSVLFSASRAMRRCRSAHTS
jgi:hypothetical protein